MSWSFGGLLVQKDFSQKLEQFLEWMEYPAAVTRHQLTFERALALKELSSAAGVINQHTLLINELVPYDCSFTPGRESSYDKQLTAASVNGSIFVFLLDGVSGTYGYVLFEKGKRIRRWAADSQQLLSDEGEPLPFEKDFTKQKVSDGEKKVIAALEYYLKTSFAELIKDEEPHFFRLAK